MGKIKRFEDFKIWQKYTEFAKMVIELAEKIHTDKKYCRRTELSRLI